MLYPDSANDGSVASMPHPDVAGRWILRPHMPQLLNILMISSRKQLTPSYTGWQTLPIAAATDKYTTNGLSSIADSFDASQRSVSTAAPDADDYNHTRSFSNPRPSYDTRPGCDTITMCFAPARGSTFAVTSPQFSLSILTDDYPVMHIFF